MADDDGWGTARVRRYAPDAASFAAAQKLSRAGVWSDVGKVDQLLWGKCQGSGATPYQVTVDLAGPAVRCGCPSRKHPCKHGLGLLLRWLHDDDGPGSASHSSPAPDDAQTWAAQRATLAARKDDAAKPKDHAASAKRLEKRLALMDGGMAEFRRWVTDLVVDGLAAARARPHGWWDLMAARLVDAQMPGLADRVRGVPGVIGGRDDWASVLLGEVARWHLTIAAWERRDDLHADDTGDLRTFLGWSRPSAEVLDGPLRHGEWTVVGVGTRHTGRVTEQRTWLHHPEEGYAAVLDFAGGTAVPTAPQLLGSVVSVPVGVYPGRPPRRVTFAADPVTIDHADSLVSITAPGWAAALDRVSGVVAAAPWQDRFPCAVAGVRLIDLDSEQPKVVDADGLAVVAVDFDPWPTLALTGGGLVSLFGELVGGVFRPLTIEVDAQLVAVPPEPQPDAWEGWAP